MPHHPAFHSALRTLLAVLLCAALPAAHAQEPFRAVILSDFNGPYGSVTYPAPLGSVMRRVLNEWQPDLLLSAGDVVAGQKASLPDARVREMWRAFDTNVARPLREAGVPYAFAAGNHDASLARDRKLAAEYWNAPAHVPQLNFADRTHYPFAFTFTFGGVFFAVADAPGSTLRHADWLEAQLSSREAREARMRVVIGHLPLYGVSAGKNRPGEVLTGAERLRALFERHRVHTYVSGHHAAYYPGRRGQLNVLATGGIGGRDYVGHPNTARSTVTVADFDPAAGVIRLSTYDAVTGALIGPESLPPFLNGLNGRVERVRELR